MLSIYTITKGLIQISVFIHSWSSFFLIFQESLSVHCSRIYITYFEAGLDSLYLRWAHMWLVPPGYKITHLSTKLSGDLTKLLLINQNRYIRNSRRTFFWLPNRYRFSKAEPFCINAANFGDILYSREGTNFDSSKIDMIIDQVKYRSFFQKPGEGPSSKSFLFLAKSCMFLQFQKFLIQFLNFPSKRLLSYIN